MAVSNPETISAPRWPADPIIPERVYVDYDIPADEFLVYFGGKPVPAMSSQLNAPGFDDVAVMFAFDKDDRKTDEIVGIQVIPMLLGAVQEQPAWAVLAWAAMAGEFGTEFLKERLPGFLRQIQDAFESYWTPPPPMDEQVAQLRQSRQRDEGCAASDTVNPAGHE